jgi:hypothetical protein
LERKFNLNSTGRMRFIYLKLCRWNWSKLKFMWNGLYRSNLSGMWCRLILWKRSLFEMCSLQKLSMALCIDDYSRGVRFGLSSDLNIFCCQWNRDENFNCLYKSDAIKK